MKKILFTIPVLIGAFLHAQYTGKVGVNTQTPTENAHVNGTLRVGNLPTTGTTNAIYTKPDGTVSSAKDQTFTQSKMLVVDANGVVGQANLPVSAVTEPWRVQGSSNEATTNTQNIYQKGTVGIGDFSASGSAATNQLHVKASADPLRIEGLQLTTDPTDVNLVTDANGVVKKTFLGRTKFAGYRNADLTGVNNTINKIFVENEALDIFNEYDPATGIFTCKQSGLYFFEALITYTTTGTNGWGDHRGVLGFADSSTNQWVARFNFEGSTDPRSFYSKGIVQMTAGKTYYFGVAAPVNTTLNVIANPTGSTGSGIGTFFALTRITVN